MNSQKTSRLRRDRTQVVLNMSNKLAAKGDNDFVAAAKNQPSQNKIWFWILMSLFILVVTFPFLLVRQNKKVESSVTTAPQVINANPAQSIMQSYKSGNITPDLCARYLGYILFRYDSLPDEYRLQRPIVKSNDVYKALLEIWPKVSYTEKNSLKSQMPNLDERLREVATEVQ